MNLLNKINGKWIKKFSYPLIIAGPCSAENKSQILDTAKNINKDYVEVFRAGIWKPRTKPGMFEGVGEIGLKWLMDAKKKYNFLIATEIANKKQAEIALKYDIDILWIGARSTCNPFTVEEIANTLKNTKKIILIKNPLSLDINLWLGGVERLINKNIFNIGLIHRGFTIYPSKTYRNLPCWLEVVNIKKDYPNIPIICDPSHITGDSKLILEVSKKAIDFGYDGLMVETHINPDNALSDAYQQITPDKLTDILNKILFKKKNNNFNEINLYRTNILEIDKNIIYLLKKRLNSSKLIGKIKKKNNIEIIQKEKMLELKEYYKSICKSINIDENYIQNLFDIIHKKSIEVQLK
ncbi:MAG: bifunctional 3-deoxy-7-phosphoheptulonate synthase/chorismate mutase type II [Candidatus Shikimatogenerans bostrichidophilus]|nr:MAG: bifunctional 3-deoxy-7-phosphoheptulonate synthase/chorismate mutase type II [Candidatus Shikimatogenerans bostrichidophilus]